MTTRRHLLATGLSAATLLVGCAAPGRMPPSLADRPPVVFVHGNGDSAALWLTTLWRFESNGWPRDRLFALDMPYPLARDDDAVAQPGRSSTADHVAFLAAEVERIRARTGADRVVLVGNSRGGYAIRNYIAHRGGDRTVSHAVLGGTPNHGVWAIPGWREGSEFSGTGPFLTALNAPKNAAGDEVAGPVRWLTIRSDANDKFAQPDGVWIGRPGQPTNVTAAGPALRGAQNVAIPRIDHRETSFSPAAFDATWRFLTGTAPRTLDVVAARGPVVLDGRVTGTGIDGEPRAGSVSTNLPVTGAVVEVFAVDPATGERRGGALHRQTVGAGGRWGPFQAMPDAAYEFVVAPPGYATTHIYRSPFPRSSDLVHLRPERVVAAEAGAAAVVALNRPRGYFDRERDTIALDGIAALPGVPPRGAGVSASRIVLADAAARPVVGVFNGERIVGRPWPRAAGHVTVIELTY